MTRAVADDVVVMYLGRVVEAGSADQVFAPPYHPYTEALLPAVPAARASGRRIGQVCDTDPPPKRISPDGHRILCHIPVTELALVPPVFPPPEPGKIQ